MTLKKAREIANTDWSDTILGHTWWHGSQRFTHPVCDRSEIWSDRSELPEAGVQFYRTAIEDAQEWMRHAAWACDDAANGNHHEVERHLRECSFILTQYGNDEQTLKLAAELGWKQEEGEFFRDVETKTVKVPLEKLGQRDPAQIKDILNKIEDLLAVGEHIHVTITTGTDFCTDRPPEIQASIDKAIEEVLLHSREARNSSPEDAIRRVSIARVDAFYKVENPYLEKLKLLLQDWIEDIEAALTIQT